MKTVDFANIKVNGLEKEETLDTRKTLGNYLYYQSSDLIGSELGRQIYFAEKPLELDEEREKIVKDAVKQIYKSYVVRKAIEKAFGE